MKRLCLTTLGKKEEKDSTLKCEDSQSVTHTVPPLRRHPPLALHSPPTKMPTQGTELSTFQDTHPWHCTLHQPRCPPPALHSLHSKTTTPGTALSTTHEAPIPGTALSTTQEALFSECYHF
ncbi:hypothetical protein E2C01_018193 [Portunus trituberculatus]|uniref:Uncharacterized protein n=1 Tax=Portunus trituberculatus TaxID=210409 RepID=A0A5B7DVR4_PORTR|nr:hypothetical protein [Portunus trituberculatus]